MILFSNAEMMCTLEKRDCVNSRGSQPGTESDNNHIAVLIIAPPNRSTALSIWMIIAMCDMLRARSKEVQ